MGPWHSYLYLVLFLIVSAERKNSTIKYSDRRGKALKISKKPCSDPNGRKGICTFKWDCINHNGTLMGTCMDGFIFGTCCQYDYDPLLVEDALDEYPVFHDSNNFIFDDHRNVYSTTSRRTTTRSPTQSTPIQIIYPSTRRSTTTAPIRPVVTTIRSTAIARPATTSSTSTTTTTTRRPTVTASASSSTGLVTWSSVGPTRRPQPVPQRPIILSPFPFRPGLNFRPSQGTWPIGIAFPVDPFNRPLQVFRPPYVLQTAQSTVSNQTVQSTVSNQTALSTVSNQTAPLSGTNFTIFNGADRPALWNSSLTNDSTTISVPIPQWTTAASAGTISLQVVTNNLNRPTSLQPQRPFLFISESSSTSQKTTSPTTRRPNLDYRRDCGVRALGPKGRIVGGQSAYFGRWPWQVLVKEAAWLGLYQKNKCGGVLVSAKYAITAGHCQPGRFLSSLVVILGEHDILTDRERLKPEMRRVKRMIVHRHYNPQNFDNDIALLELDPPVVFRPHISPICLPEPDEDFTGRSAFVSGWGKTTHGGAIPNLLQEVQVPIMSNADCVEMFKEAGHTKLIKPTFLCAGYKAGGKDSCEGDSGGPLMVERENGQWVLVGTVSHGIRCADANLPGVYMRISAYRPWIDKIMKI
ncbi:Serine proteinase stubble [Araneus ventricosus]|uniref:Serine proteinase stubble n=1 Tax=Araneus ventricosus TaxID=182803 RepID=A0A4Y2BC71_ARAVE|nr:Serine proteinase stubble [Araneus ventricosus]